jgi:hypothetical protein
MGQLLMYFDYFYYTRFRDLYIILQRIVGDPKGWAQYSKERFGTGIFYSASPCPHCGSANSLPVLGGEAVVFQLSPHY